MKIKVILTILLALVVATPVTLEASPKKKKEKIKEVKAEPTNRLRITDAARQLGGDWNIELVNRKVVHTAERAYMYFYFNKRNQVYACTGCNTTNGAFTVKGNELKFSNLSATALPCSGTAVEEEINDAMRAVTSFYVTRVDNVDFMHLTDKHGTPLLVLRRQNYDCLQGLWLVKNVGGSNVSSKEIKLVIDMDQLTVNASSGCNIINGVITVDHNKDYAVEFEDLKSSLDNCPTGDTDMQVLIALEETAFCHKKNDNETELRDRDNNVLMVLKRISAKQLK